ncbi:MAG: hypothetical protein ABI564_01795 [Ideonella sp.]
MAQKVLASFEDAARANCVDIFVRTDGTFGFEEFRANLDAGIGWNSVARYSHLIFTSGEAALCEAQALVSWMNPSERWRW